MMRFDTGGLAWPDAVAVATICVLTAACCGSSPMFTLGSAVPLGGNLRSAYDPGFETGVATEGHLVESSVRLRAGISYFRWFEKNDGGTDYEGFGLTGSVFRYVTPGSRGTALYLGAGASIYRSPTSILRDGDASISRRDVSVSPHLSAVVGLALGRDRRVVLEFRPGWACCVGRTGTDSFVHGFTLPILLGFK